MASAHVLNLLSDEADDADCLGRGGVVVLADGEGHTHPAGPHDAEGVAAGTSAGARAEHHRAAIQLWAPGEQRPAGVSSQREAAQVDP